MAQVRTPITAPGARPPRYGLLAAAAAATETDTRALAGGWAYLPDGCTPGGADGADCAGSVTSAMTVPASPDTIEGDPVWLWAGDTCSTFGFNSRDWEGRARRVLAATESFQLADELWSGAIAQAESLANRWLAGPGANSDTVTNGATSEVKALSCVEAALASYLSGQQGMVHVTPQLLTVLASERAIERSGNLWITAMGNVVVADAGYDGSGPGGSAAGASQWMYGTPLLYPWLGPVEMIPGSLADARGLSQAMDRGVNDLTIIAGRLAGVLWANECAHIAAQVDLRICLIGGAS